MAQYSGIKKLWLAGFLIPLIFYSGCSQKIHTSRSQFVKDQVPTVNLNKYRSVQERPDQDPDLAVAVAISGGGSRAYNFAMGVLLGLEEIKTGNSNSMLREIDYFSTVSGGGFAAGGYISALFDHLRFNSGKPFRLRQYYESRLQAELGKSYVSPVVKSWVNPRNWFSYLDDGDALERAIDYNVLGYRDRKRQYGRVGNTTIRLGDLFIKKSDTTRPVLLPMMVANGTIYTSMAIFPFAPDIVDTFQICGYSHHFRQFKSESPIDPFSLPLSVGIKASGSFPVAISNTTLTSTYDDNFRYLHIMDGGIADNIGYQTAIDLLRQDTAASRKLLIVVDADGGGIVKTFSRNKGGALAINVYSKLPSSGLDSRHNLLRKELSDRCYQNGITPVFLSFGTLIEDNENLPPEIILRNEEQQRLVAQLKLAPQIITGKDLQILYELVTHVKTKYTIKPLEQQLLTLTGQKVTQMKQPELLKLIRAYEKI